ncbi:MAG: septum formation inhibitor Maf [Oceanospirillales bacterium]|uniref:7-methyl-GTP pyrophosphatase n=1 Tax=Marinobacterium halophilum TaxID=267374 RepID=A0A2P8EKJ8_9GAMM|nr:nucleoside triphosphate pyrophosphatase [Marinobacterium halophilum]MBR9828204.1 septum formation inhibitor Maf [Oceanospirillales bacterium]PSL10003.1 MAF protein [Marinobacterium halophilum]
MLPTLVLASSSPWRREILDKLGLPYRTKHPEIDETPLPGETAAALVSRLAEEKARAVSTGFKDALIIGSDQVAVLDGNIIGKPGTHERAVEQLRAASGRTLTFLTGLCLLNAATGKVQVDVVPYHVHFRTLSDTLIERYLQHEQPYNCAGSFRSEQAGIVLFERLEGDDPNTLVGLPLIRLVRMLEAEGVEPF